MHFLLAFVRSPKLWHFSGAHSVCHPQHGCKLPAAPAAMHWYLSRFKAQEWREREEAGCFVFLFRKLFPDICARISSLELCPVITHGGLKQMEIDFTVLPYTLYDKGRKFNKRSPQYIATVYIVDSVILVIPGGAQAHLPHSLCAFSTPNCSLWEIIFRNSESSRWFLSC